eukprot:58945-Rhodomonas_salina.1
MAMALRWLAGGSYLDQIMLFWVSHEAFFVALWATLEAFTSEMPITFSFRRDDLEETARGFLARQRKPIFHGVCGAVDCILIKVQCPTPHKYSKPAQFYTRKQYYALNVQAVVDAKRRFLFLSMDCPGSVHASTAFTASALGQHQERLPA